MNKKNNILRQVIKFYLDSRDNNGLPVSRIKGNKKIIKSTISELIREGKIVINFGDRHPNPHILAIEPEPIEQQLEKVENNDMEYACLYPTRGELAKIVKPDELLDRPYTRLLRLGEPHLNVRYFDLTVLEFYRNDPRFRYAVDEIEGSISVKSEYYESDQIRTEDKTFLQTFGFGYSRDLKTRVVVVFSRYLSDLTPEHQQIWKAKELTGDYFPHPEYIRMSSGQISEQVPIFTAFTTELNQINVLSKMMARKPLFKKDYSGNDRPREFSFLIRPTQKEFNQFVHLLDKMLSENFNREFFQNEVEYVREKTDSMGRVIQENKNTISILEEWLTKYWRFDDPQPIKDMIQQFRQIRKDRQSPAHAIKDDVFDMELLAKQRDLIKNAYKAVRLLRLILMNHSRTASYKPPDWLQQGKIISY